MFYFTYKLLRTSEGGYQPKNDVSETWFDIGYCQQADGTLLGHSEKSIASAFDSKAISNFQIQEITQQQALSLAATKFNKATVGVDGKIYDADPPYLERRGKTYIDGELGKVGK